MLNMKLYLVGGGFRSSDACFNFPDVFSGNCHLETMSKH